MKLFDYACAALVLAGNTNQVAALPHPQERSGTEEEAPHRRLGADGTNGARSRRGRARRRTHQCGDFGNLYAFGDSVTDNGNGKKLPICSDPQAQCLDRNTNGDLIVDYLADELSFGLLTPSGSPPFSSLKLRGNNFAVGAASASNDYTYPLDFKEFINFPAQVSWFHASVQSSLLPPVSAKDLFFVQFGPNDVQDALLVAGGNLDVFLQAATVSFAEQISKLINAGAKKFLVVNSPNVGASPIFNILDSTGMTATIVRGLTLVFNTLLEAALSSLRTQYSDVDIFYFDLFGTFEALLASYAVADVPCVNRYFCSGVLNTTVPKCYNVNPSCDLNDDADGFAFFDEFHPTTSGYESVSDKIVQAYCGHSNSGSGGSRK